VVACSAAAASTLRPLSRRQPAPTVIYNGCEAGRPGLCEPERTEKRGQLGIAPGQFVLIMVGQITPRKGQLPMIRAFSRVRKSLPNAVLLLCGAPLFNDDHRYLADLHTEADRLGVSGSVRFLGQRSDAVEIIAAADLCIVNSTREPFGLTIVEAMTVGTPVIATDCGGPAEIIRHGADGEIIPVGDENSLVRAVLRLAADPAQRSHYAAAGAEKVGQQFSRAQYIRQWCAVYEEISLASVQFARRRVRLEARGEAPQ
jgi:glycosyltransferase involved in cell wall biosynthesis